MWRERGANVARMFCKSIMLRELSRIFYSAGFPDSQAHDAPDAPQAHPSEFLVSRAPIAPIALDSCLPGPLAFSSRRSLRCLPVLRIVSP